MALHGDVDQIPLSHILQGLLLNGQEGLLKLQGKSLERKVHVLSLVVVGVPAGAGRESRFHDDYFRIFSRFRVRFSHLVRLKR